MLTGIDQSDYSKIETGKRNMTFEQCRRIADALETSMDYLAGEPPIPAPIPLSSRNHSNKSSFSKPPQPLLLPFGGKSGILSSIYFQKGGTAMNLCDEATIRALLERHGFHFSKTHGAEFPDRPADPL